MSCRVRLVVLFAMAGCVALFGCAAKAPQRGDFAADQALLAEVKRAIAELGPNTRAAVWLSAPPGEPLLAIGADEPMPVASAIKVGYLVELFGSRPDDLYQPLPDAAAVLANERHPAINHFSPAQRETALEALGNASVRRIGEAMITGKGVDNATYNLAANLVTAHFGGPASLEARLHARGADWQGLRVRRYMLADRKLNGDNEATARSLAAVHGQLALADVPGLDGRTVAEVRSILARPADATGRASFAKGGSLDSDPVTRVEAGWHEGPEHTLVHVVMLAQDGVPAGERAAAGQRLGNAARSIAAMLVKAR
ncbi:MAG TPA: hypothetical protein VF384_00860 [Planctomycetota bacterium]